MPPCCHWRKVLLLILLLLLLLVLVLVYHTDCRCQVLVRCCPLLMPLVQQHS
jgi:hypothetical protein